MTAWPMAPGSVPARPAHSAASAATAAAVSATLRRGARVSAWASVSPTASTRTARMRR